MKNSDEDEARRAKALALLAVMDRNARQVGMPPLAGKRALKALGVDPKKVAEEAAAATKAAKTSAPAAKKPKGKRPAKKKAKGRP